MKGSSDAGGNPTNDESAAASSAKRSAGGTMSKLYELCPKKRRVELFQSSIPGWVEAKTKLNFHGEKAQKFHKAIFEKCVIDLDGFYEVAKPGFLRMCAQLHPNFEVASKSYYRSMLEPAYERVKGVIREKLELDAPPIIAIGLDLWSQFHHGYMVRIQIDIIFNYLGALLRKIRAVKRAL